MLEGGVDVTAGALWIVGGEHLAGGVAGPARHDRVALRLCLDRPALGILGGRGVARQPSEQQLLEPLDGEPDRVAGGGGEGGGFDGERDRHVEVARPPFQVHVGGDEAPVRTCARLRQRQALAERSPRAVDIAELPAAVAHRVEELGAAWVVGRDDVEGRLDPCEDLGPHGLEREVEQRDGELDERVDVGAVDQPGVRGAEVGDIGIDGGEHPVGIVRSAQRGVVLARHSHEMVGMGESDRVEHAPLRQAIDAVLAHRLEHLEARRPMRVGRGGEE